jgi:hypothetical protein
LALKARKEAEERDMEEGSFGFDSGPDQLMTGGIRPET